MTTVFTTARASASIQTTRDNEWTVSVSHQSSALSNDVLEEQDGYWTVTNAQTGIFGSGPTPDDAFSDFAAALRDHLDVLERQDALAPALVEQLAYLRGRIS
jgi:predicted RNase H-like HicB family nuclease